MSRRFLAARLLITALVIPILVGGGCEADPPPAQPKLSPLETDRRGDIHLKAGRFDLAIVDFDVYIAANPSVEPQHWRRGIAYYYAGRYQDGIRQFESHRTVNSDDVENAVWHFLCKAKLAGVVAAKKALLPVGPDGRIPMMTVYEMFAGRATPTDVAREAKSASGTRRSASALFYCHLYLGLYYEATGVSAKALHHLELSAKTHTTLSYMGDLARMHVEMLAK